MNKVRKTRIVRSFRWRAVQRVYCKLFRDSRKPAATSKEGMAFYKCFSLLCLAEDLNEVDLQAQNDPGTGRCQRGINIGPRRGSPQERQ